MRQVVFVGNCQVEALSQLYRRFAGREATEHVHYLPSYQDLTDERVGALARADVIIEQRMDVAPRAEIEGIATNAERQFVPLLAGGFLWPFAGQPHPRNESLWFLTGGPFDGEMGDSYLNRLLERGVAAEDAAAKYIALDVNAVRNLDRLAELILDRQRARDAACGYEFATLFEEHFRSEPLFRTPHHPNRRLALAFATAFFQRMGVDAAGVARMEAQVRVTPFPKNELPVHPSVARHFGLTWADEATRYQFHDEGAQTFAEYALRYARYEWNRALAEGIALAGREPERALMPLAEGLIRCSGSAPGWFSYGEALRSCGRLMEAEAAARRGITADPADGRQYYGLAHTLAAAGRLDEAAEAAEQAIAREEFDPHFHGLRASLAMRRGRPDEAEAWLREALVLTPNGAHLHNTLGALLVQMGRVEEALGPMRRAIELAPEAGVFHAALSHTLLRLGQGGPALAAAREAVARAPGDAGFAAHLESLLQQEGSGADAEAALRAAIAARPDDPSPRDRLGHVLMLAGRPEEAAESFRAAAALAPDAMGPLAGLSHALTRLGQVTGAVAAAEAALARDDRFAPLHVHLGNLLWVQGRIGEAEAAYLAALARDAELADAMGQLKRLRAAMAAAA